MNADEPAMDESAKNDPQLRALLEAVDARLGGVPNPEPGELAAFGELRAACRGAFSDDVFSEEVSAEGSAEAAEALRARRVVSRVLRATTREDLGAAGDLRVVLRFIGTRLQESRALRVLAAVLLVQVTVVPVIAYHLLQKAQPTTFDLEFSPRYDELLDDMPRLDPDRDYPLTDREIELPLDVQESLPGDSGAPK